MKIALALSGGGVRAMAFHVGVLRYLAEKDMLRHVAELSTVSGGSLIAGLLFARSGMRWPGAAQFPAVAASIRSTLTTTDMQAATIARAILPVNWRFWLARPNIVARTIYRDWKIKARLVDLPPDPVWSINCTTAESGKRFRFKQGRLGEYEIGYADAGNFPLASAMAISAAFPVGLGPFKLDARRFRWQKRSSWEAPQEVATEAAYRSLNLYDGGLYDNLGIEPFFDAGSGRAKVERRIIVSDAGAPLARGFGLFALNPLRIKRLMDVLMDQNRALRVRGFIRYVIDNGTGGYIGISRSASLSRSIQATSSQWLSDEQARLVSTFPTSLSILTAEQYDLIERHGYESARMSQEKYNYLGL